MVLATYQCDEGTREVVGERVDGLVRITDRRPAGGRSYLVDQGFECMAEVQALVDDYTAKAKRLGYAPMQGWFYGSEFHNYFIRCKCQVPLVADFGSRRTPSAVPASKP